MTVADFLSKNYHTILLDLPGFGDSQRPPSVWDSRDYARFVSSFLSNIGCFDTSVMGHSFGGKVALYLALRNKVPKLILVAPSGLERRSLLTHLLIFLGKLTKPFLPMQLKIALATRLGFTDWLEARQMRDILGKIVTEDIREVLSKISCPTLIIWGDRDNNQNISFAKVFKERIKNSKLRIVWGAGHNPHIEKPKEFLQILSEELL